MVHSSTCRIPAVYNLEPVSGFLVSNLISHECDKMEHTRQTNLRMPNSSLGHKTAILLSTQVVWLRTGIILFEQSAFSPLVLPSHLRSSGLSCDFNHSIQFLLLCPSRKKSKASSWSTSRHTPAMPYEEPGNLGTSEPEHGHVPFKQALYRLLSTQKCRDTLLGELEWASSSKFLR